MAYRIVKSRYEAEQSRWIKDYVLDGASDLADLPVIVGAGSTARYADDGALTVYELAPSGSWVRIV